MWSTVWYYAVVKRKCLTYTTCSYDVVLILVCSVYVRTILTHEQAHIIVDVVFYFQEKLAGIVFGMLRQRQFNMLDTYKDEAFSAVRALLKQVSIDKTTSFLHNLPNFWGPFAVRDIYSSASLFYARKILQYNLWLIYWNGCQEQWKR